MKRILFFTLTLLILPHLSWAQNAWAHRENDRDLTATGSVTLNVRGLADVSVQLSGTFSATIAFEASNDVNDGDDWVTLACDVSTASAAAVVSATTEGMWRCPIAGMKDFRARVASYTSGTVEIHLAGSAAARQLPTPFTVNAAMAGAWDNVGVNVLNVPVVTVDNLGPTAASAYATSDCYPPTSAGTTASTNAFTCAAAVANFYGFRAANPTSTWAYLRLYNLAANPTCSSATGFIETIAIPPSKEFVAPELIPSNYTTGIAGCVTGGPTSTDNTNAPAGVLIKIKYK